MLRGADTCLLGVAVGFDPEDGVLVGDGCEIGCWGVAIDGDVGASAWHLLEIAIDDRWTLGYRYLNELTGSAASPAQDYTPVGGAYVLDPVATLSKHGDEKPLTLPVRHAERETRCAAPVSVGTGAPLPALGERRCN